VSQKTVNMFGTFTQILIKLSQFSMEKYEKIVEARSISWKSIYIIMIS